MRILARGFRPFDVSQTAPKKNGNTASVFTSVFHTVSIGALITVL